MLQRAIVDGQGMVGSDPTSVITPTQSRAPSASSRSVHAASEPTRRPRRIGTQPQLVHIMDKPKIV